MRIAVTGSSGLIGQALVKRLSEDGHQVFRLVRQAVPADPLAIPWDPAHTALDPHALEGLDALVHLAGENLAAGRWTPARKAVLRDSRVHSTTLLARIMATLKQPPAVWLSASATGYYGSRGDEPLTEASPPGQGFLADVCQAWEAAAQSLPLPKTRVILLRTGVVLSPLGGALAKMLLPFKLGLGGRIGSGRQYLSWITLADEVAAILFLLTRPDLSGPVNLVSPQPATNREFTRTLGRVLHRPTLLPLPALAARLALGEMADETLLASTRALPARLTPLGYTFQFPDLDGALHHLLS